ncbi:hypothetical protein MRX96_000886 [Rhipicephalus microplus]
MRPSAMTDTRMDDEVSDVSENDEDDFGWQVAAGRRSRAEKCSAAANETLLATQEEQPLQVERRAGELRILNAWCHASYWDHLG